MARERFLELVRIAITSLVLAFALSLWQRSCGYGRPPSFWDWKLEAERDAEK